MILNRISLTDGQLSLCSSKDYNFKDLKKIAVWLNSIMNSDQYHALPFNAPVFQDFKAAAYNIDGCLLMIICTYPDNNYEESVCEDIGIPLLSFGITRNGGGDYLWGILNEKFSDGRELLGISMPAAPWMATVNYTSSHSYSILKGDFASIEQVFGWAWLFFISYSEACITGAFPVYEAPVAASEPEGFDYEMAINVG